MNDLQIQKVIDQYVKNRQYQRDYYRNRYNTDEDFKNKAKDNAKTYYTNNIDKRKEKYETNKEFLQAQRRYRYWLKKDDLEGFKTKYPEDFESFFNN
tara:strand:+ start:454 stop:744 length:291 start_codon:yes stop_codon:yes gene_type:complete